MTFLLINLALLISHLWLVAGHGFLVEPPSRSSMWRQGYRTEPNYQDNQLFCGGFYTQWTLNKGKCGICGDPYDGPRENEAGGKYANGIIVRSYSMGQVIQVSVKITANHLGYFKFNICPNNDVHTAATQECLDSYPLRIHNSAETRYYISGETKIFDLLLDLPDGLACEQCVFQWIYNTGNSWGVCEDGSQAMGCGAQEQFRGCADVSISSDGRPPIVKMTTEKVVVEPTPEKVIITQTQEPEKPGNCIAIGPFSGNAAMDKWCRNNCARDHCPEELCKC